MGERTEPWTHISSRRGSTVGHTGAPSLLPSLSLTLATPTAALLPNRDKKATARLLIRNSVRPVVRVIPTNSTNGSVRLLSVDRHSLTVVSRPWPLARLSADAGRGCIILSRVEASDGRMPYLVRTAVLVDSQYCLASLSPTSTHMTTSPPFSRRLNFAARCTLIVRLWRDGTVNGCSCRSKVYPLCLPCLPGHRPRRQVSFSSSHSSSPSRYRHPSRVPSVDLRRECDVK